MQIAHREKQYKAKFIHSVWVYSGGTYFYLLCRPITQTSRAYICDQCLSKTRHIQVMYIHCSLHLEK